MEIYIYQLIYRGEAKYNIVYAKNKEEAEIKLKNKYGSLNQFYVLEPVK